MITAKKTRITVLPMAKKTRMTVLPTAKKIRMTLARRPRIGKKRRVYRIIIPLCRRIPVAVKRKEQVVGRYRKLVTVTALP